MDDERKSSKAGERAAEGLREATAKEEAKNESKTGHDLAKGADRFEERSKSSDGKRPQEKQKGEQQRPDTASPRQSMQATGHASVGDHPLADLR